MILRAGAVTVTTPRIARRGRQAEAGRPSGVLIDRVRVEGGHPVERPALGDGRELNSAQPTPGVGARRLLRESSRGELTEYGDRSRRLLMRRKKPENFLAFLHLGGAQFISSKVDRIEVSG